jgi:hypothetical protein
LDSLFLFPFPYSFRRLQGHQVAKNGTVLTPQSSVYSLALLQLGDMMLQLDSHGLQVKQTADVSVGSHGL